MDIGLLQRQILDGFEIRDQLYASIEDLILYCKRTGNNSALPYLQQMVDKLERLKEHEQSIMINVFKMEGDDEQTS